MTLLLVVSCTGTSYDSIPPNTTSPVTPATTRPVSTSTTAGPCVPNSNDTLEAFGSAMEDIAAAIFTRRPTELEAIVGDGQVYDPLLDPTDGVISYPNVAEWTAAAERVNDRIASSLGYTVGWDPVAIHGERSSEPLEALGFDSVGVSVYVYAQSCEYRIVVSPEVVSGDDACAVYAALGEDGDVGAPLECTTEMGSVGRTSHVAAWTGEEMIVWGGTRSFLTNEDLSSGVAFHLQTNEWRRIADLEVSDPLLAYQAEAVWTGTEMLVYGPSLSGILRGFLFDPADDTWTEAASLPLVDRSYVGASAWTGEELFLYGGDINYPANDGWIYTPATDTWDALPASPGEPTEAPEAVWTGKEYMIWGGNPNQGLVYSPVARSWQEISLAPQPNGTQSHVMVWTGDEVLVWGGQHSGPGQSTAPVTYNVDTDRWLIGNDPPILGRERFPTIWTGEAFVVWGGLAYVPTPILTAETAGDGATYDPDLDAWTPMATSPLDYRCDHTGVWTGSVVIYFGGYEQCGNLAEFSFGTGAMYDPATDTWELLPAPPV